MRTINSAIADAKEFALRAEEDAKSAHADVKDAYAAAKDGAKAAVDSAEGLMAGLGDVLKSVGAAVVEAEIRGAQSDDSTDGNAKSSM